MQRREEAVWERTVFSSFPVQIWLCFVWVSLLQGSMLTGLSSPLRSNRSLLIAQLCVCPLQHWHRINQLANADVMPVFSSSPSGLWSQVPLYLESVAMSRNEVSGAVTEGWAWMELVSRWQGERKQSDSSGLSWRAKAVENRSGCFRHRVSSSRTRAGL